MLNHQCRDNETQLYHKQARYLSTTGKLGHMSIVLHQIPEKKLRITPEK